MEAGVASRILVGKVCGTHSIDILPVRTFSPVAIFCRGIIINPRSLSVCRIIMGMRSISF